MIQYFCGIERAQLLWFSRQTDRLVCDRVCVPSFAHSGDYALHSFLRRFYDGFKQPVAPAPSRRLCLSRQGVEASTRGVWRILENRAAFEALAVQRGYEIVRPENLSFAEQIGLFQSAAAVIGEHGSGMHGAIFAGAGTRVACFPMSNAIQFRIGALCAHTNIYLNRIDSRTDAQGIFRYSAAERDLADMMAIVDRSG
jgi:capsular polysaccharide biosynthesis protein